MSPGAAFYLPALPLITGWGLRRVVGLAAPTPALLAVPVFGVAALGLWGLLLSLAAVPWSPLTLPPLPVLAATAGCLLSAPVWQPEDATPFTAWDAAAAMGTLASVSLVAAGPAAGWDFRYLWGLKAEVYALARGIDATWLSWFPNIPLHPHYPPLWSVLIAEGNVLGFGVSWAGSVLSAGCLTALAAICWWAARRAHPALRMLAALTGTAAPSPATLGTRSRCSPSSWPRDSPCSRSFPQPTAAAGAACSSSSPPCSPLSPWSRFRARSSRSRCSSGRRSPSSAAPSSR